jgi:hypothetical protein
MGTTGAVPACEEKSHLLRVYSFAAADHGRALEVLKRWTGVMPQAEYRTIRTYVEKTRELAEHARLALERHIAEHGCGPWTDTTSAPGDNSATA